MHLCDFIHGHMDHRGLGMLVICFTNGEAYGQCMALGSAMGFVLTLFLLGKDRSWAEELQ